MIPSSFFVETLPLSIMDTRGNFPAFSETKCFRFKGTPSDFLETLREFSAKHPGLKYELNSPDSWTGITSESPLEALQTGYSRDALKTFQGAAAALSTPMQKGTPRLAPEGSSYSMARVIQGHPIAAFKRPKVKLPPKALEFSVNCQGNVMPEDIAKAVSRIARAAWEYQAAGGPVTVTAHYLYSLRIPRDGVIAAIVSLSLPLANLSQFATGASVQMYRGFCMPLRSEVLAGSRITGAPVMRWNNPRVFPINGEAKNDEKSLAALGVA